MRNGYKFAVIFKEDIELSEKDIKRLEIFSYILIDENISKHKQFGNTEKVIINKKGR